jgi:hypothetical protein
VFTDAIQDGYPSIYQGRNNGAVYWGDFGKKTKVKVSAGAFDGKSVALALQLLEHSTHVPFGALQLLGCLVLGDLPLVRLFQHHQPVSIPLRHAQNSCVFRLPSLTPSIGLF